MSRKVILSRKGFDGTTGGYPSPMMNGKLVSLPIPRADSGVFYKDLRFSESESYLQVMKDLGIHFYSETHLDPDLHKPILKERPKDWRGLFGQSGNSQGTLYKREVGKGDLFLFFGWFKEAENINGRWKYKKDAPDLHVIFGYLEVDRVLDIRAGDPVPEWAKDHPHIKWKDTYGNQRNSVYVATSTFSAHCEKPGWGTFAFDEQLVLTKKGAKNKSLWELPPCFQNEQDQFNQGIKTWHVMDHGWVEVQTSGRGDQELFISSNPEIVAWAENLVRSCPLQ